MAERRRPETVPPWEEEREDTGSPEERRGNLPGVAGQLIGREGELAALRGQFEAGVRLVTVSGPAGMGKSRLATHFGWEQLRARTWEGGVWRCDLMEAFTVEDLCHALGEALGVSLSRVGGEQDSTALLGRALVGHGALLVILDNVEHLLQHLPATLGRWLELAPRARFLATSREALRLGGERVLELPPLGLPAEGETRLEEIARSEAVRLFVQRAREVRGEYTLTAGEAPRVAEIVQRLGGIALAIELAAARTQLLSVEQLREQLGPRFELPRAQGPARQDTLQGAIEWSWRLLNGTEQAALAQCAVFRGGFSLEAAEAVLALPARSPAVAEVIESLRSKALLRGYTPDAAAEGETRLGMYESIREYALARLRELGEEASLVERHADFHLAKARRLQEQVRGPGGREALRHLALERENLLAACDSALAAAPTVRAVERALEALVVLEPDVAARGPMGLTLSRMERALELARQLPVSALLRTEVLAARGRMYGASGRVQAARRDLEEAKASFQALGEPARQKHVLVDLSILTRHAGEMETSWLFIQEAMALELEEERWLEAYAVGNLGLVEQLRSGASAAAPHLRAARRLFWTLGDVMFESGFLTNCAVAVGDAGETQEAITLLREAMEKATRAGDSVGHAIARLNLGCFLLEGDGAEEARGHLEAAMRMGRRLGMTLLEGCALGELGRAHLAMGALEAARAHLSEAVALLSQAGRWQALRFGAHLAAVQATAGELAEARAGLAGLEAAPELPQDAVLYALINLMHTAVDLAEARASPPGSEEAREALEQARERVERARSAPAEAVSSDLRAALRFFERALGAPGLKD